MVPGLKELTESMGECLQWALQVFQILAQLTFLSLSLKCLFAFRVPRGHRPFTHAVPSLQNALSPVWSSLFLLFLLLSPQVAFPLKILCSPLLHISCCDYSHFVSLSKHLSQAWFYIWFYEYLIFQQFISHSKMSASWGQTPCLFLLSIVL